MRVTRRTADELVIEEGAGTAEARFTSVDDIDTHALARWLEKARTIQWDYKNIVKRRGVLERLR